MANKFTRFLTGFGNGLTNPKGLVGNFQHATRLFLDNSYRLAPRTKFNYYVRFEFDRTALKQASKGFEAKHSEEVGYLVKNCSLPNYTFTTETKNQYNRKKVLYKDFSYDPVDFTFHDDNGGVINAMWALYYGYYIKDRNNPEPAFGATHYRNEKIPALDNYRFGLDNGRSVPFFKNISIYTMARQRWLGYTLVNPKIKTWQHGTPDYAEDSMPMENKMSVEYESVYYSGGIVKRDNPKGFATLYYDNSPSPLTLAGGGLSTLTSEGGVLDGLESIFGSVADGTAFSSPQNFLGTAIGAINTYKNFKNLDKDSLKAEAINLIRSPESINGIVNTVSGVAGAIFPKNQGTTTTTTASQKNLTDTQGSS